MIKSLKEIGWSDFFEKEFQQLNTKNEYLPGRVIIQRSQFYQVITEKGEYETQISGRLKYAAAVKSELPVVGDWVAIKIDTHKKNGIIHHILPRKTRFSRKVAGTTTNEQVMGANIDTVFIVTSLDSDYSPSRVMRYMLLVYEAGARPVVVLNKADICPDLEAKIAVMQSVVLDVPVLATSVVTGQGIDAIQELLSVGESIILVGSSGVGKSSLINSLVGKDIREIGEIRKKDQKGRHTTTYREMIFLEKQGILIDTPGLREVQLWATEEGLTSEFEDVITLAQGCKYNNCHHYKEPQCAVKVAVEQGQISQERLDVYVQLAQEIKDLQQKKEELLFQKKDKERFMSRLTKNAPYNEE